MPYKEKDISKIYWTIGEVASELKVLTSFIRYWQNEFRLKVSKNRRGNRQFTEATFNKMKQIRYLLKEKKFTLEGARQEIKETGWL